MRKPSPAKLDSYRRLRAIHLRQRKFWQIAGPDKRRHQVESLLGTRWKLVPHLMNGSHDYSRFGRGL